MFTDCGLVATYKIAETKTRAKTQRTPSSESRDDVYFYALCVAGDCALRQALACLSWGRPGYFSFFFPSRKMTDSVINLNRRPID
jgi:hypothetical protein